MQKNQLEATDLPHRDSQPAPLHRRYSANRKTALPFRTTAPAQSGCGRKGSKGQVLSSPTPNSMSVSHDFFHIEILECIADRKTHWFHSFGEFAEEFGMVAGLN